MSVASQAIFFDGAKHTLALFAKYWWGYSPLAHPLVTPLVDVLSDLTPLTVGK